MLARGAVVAALAPFAAGLLAACAHRPPPIGGRQVVTPVTAAEARARFGDPATLLVSPDTVEVVRGHGPFYPTDDTVEGYEDGAVVGFVVDTTGRVEPRTISFLRMPEMPFARSVCEYLERVRFAPVLHDGVPRRALVFNGYLFQLIGGDYDGKRIDMAPIRDVARREPIMDLLGELEALPHCLSAPADSATASAPSAP